MKQKPDVVIVAKCHKPLKIDTPPGRLVRPDIVEKDGRHHSQ